MVRPVSPTWDNCMSSVQPKKKNIIPMHNDTVPNLAPMLHHHAQSGSSQPLMLSIRQFPTSHALNQAVPNLPCSQSGSSQPPMLSIRQFPTSHAPNQAAPNLPCSQAGSSQPPMLSIKQFPTSHALNQAVPNLPCSQCTIRQSQPPMLSMYNHACSHHVPNVHSPLLPMWNTYMSFKHPANHPSPVPWVCKHL